MTTLTKTALPVGTWKVDPAHSHVGFEVEYMVGTFRGNFSPVDVTLEVGEDGEAILRGSAQAESIKVQDENLSTHLLSPEFFDAVRTPKLTFVSREIERTGTEVSIAGDLTIKGVVAPVELDGTIADPIVDAYERERVGLKLDGTVDRTHFGLNWNLPLPNGEPALANDVRVTAELYLIKA